MTFERAWVLAFLVLPLAWMAWEWRRQVRRSALLMKIAMAILVILASPKPVLETHDRKVALAALSILRQHHARRSGTQSSRCADRQRARIESAHRNPLRPVTRAHYPRRRPDSTSNAALAQRTRALIWNRPFAQALASLPAGNHPPHSAGHHRRQRE